MDVVGNPSSVHAEGRAAKGIVETARGQVADLVGCEPSEVVFTSGATEAAAMVAYRYDTFHASPIEHDCVFGHCDLPVKESYLDKSYDWWFSVGADGTVSTTRPVDHPSGAMTSQGIYDYMNVFCLQRANSETGVIQGQNLRTPDGYLSDVVQSVFREHAEPLKSCDYALVSGHKFGSAKGVGALLVSARDQNFDRGYSMASVGGGQEMGRRSGTENVIGIAGFGAAAVAAKRDLEDGVWERVEKLRDDLEDALASAASDIIFFGKEVARLPNTSCFAIPGWKGETQVMQMDLAGFAISAGSACSSGKVKESRVLRAMGFDSVTASSAIRVSMGPTITEAEVMAFANTWIEHYRRWKQRAA